MYNNLSKAKDTTQYDYIPKKEQHFELWKDQKTSHPWGNIKKGKIQKKPSRKTT